MFWGSNEGAIPKTKLYTISLSVILPRRVIISTFSSYIDDEDDLSLI